MRRLFEALVVGAALAGAGGCGSSPTTASGTGGAGWVTERDASAELSNGDTTYGTYGGRRGQRVRATVSAQPEPVEVKLLVVDTMGKETTLAEKKQTAEAVLEGAVPYDGTVQLKIRLDSGKKTACKYKIERQ